METLDHQRPGRFWAGARIDWMAALGSDDPTQQWAASCSIAEVALCRDSWVDATALYEASVGAFDAATADNVTDRVAAAFLGARRAAYWERQARIRLIPPADYAEHRWRSDVRASRRGTVALTAMDSPGLVRAEPAPAAACSTVAPWLGVLLDAAGWRWHTPACDAVADAIGAVGDVGRDAAGRELRQRHGELPAVVANNLVLLVAGSRMRDGFAWPGVVWLDANLGAKAAATDRGTIAVIDATIAERRARPVNSTTATNPRAKVTLLGAAHHPAAQRRPATRAGRELVAS